VEKCRYSWVISQNRRDEYLNLVRSGPGEIQAKTSAAIFILLFPSKILIFTEIYAFSVFDKINSK